MRLLVGVLLLSGCGNKGFVYEGPEQCDALPAVFAAHRAALHRSWELADENAPLRYVQTDNFDKCEGRACFKDATIYTPKALDEHELVHAYLAGLGNPPPLFAEGMAVAYDCSGNPSFVRDMYFSASFEVFSEWQVESEHEEEYLYAAAGQFMSTLIRTIGPKKTIAAYAACGGSTRLADCEAPFFEATNRTLKEMIQLAQLGSPACIPAWPCVMNALKDDADACAAPLLPHARTFTLTTPGYSETVGNVLTCDSMEAVPAEAHTMSLYGPGTYWPPRGQVTEEIASLDVYEDGETKSFSLPLDHGWDRTTFWNMRLIQMPPFFVRLKHKYSVNSMVVSPPGFLVTPPVAFGAMKLERLD